MAASELQSSKGSIDARIFKVYLSLIINTFIA